MKPPIPDVEATAKRIPGSPVWEMSITCPHCGQKHTHGGGTVLDANSYGHRLSHCRNRIDDCPGYNLIPAKESL